MFVMHCTKKEQDRLKVKPVDTLPGPTTRLGNWYCNEFIASRRKYLIFVNESTLLPIVISVKGLKTSGDSTAKMCVKQPSLREPRCTARQECAVPREPNPPTEEGKMR